MKTTKIFVYFLWLLVMVNTECTGQMSDKTSREKIANDFIVSLLNDTLKSETIAEQYVKYRHDEKTTKIVVWYIDGMKQYAEKKITSLDNLKIVRFKKAVDSSQKTNDILNTLMVNNESEKDDIFVVLKNNEFLFPIRFDGNRIASFSTMDKGTRRYFIDF
jgi:hypothetical protein